jgi:hypothetical protein
LRGSFIEATRPLRRSLVEVALTLRRPLVEATRPLRRPLVEVSVTLVVKVALTVIEIAALIEVTLPLIIVIALAGGTLAKIALRPLVKVPHLGVIIIRAWFIIRPSLVVGVEVVVKVATLSNVVRVIRPLSIGHWWWLIVRTWWWWSAGRLAISSGG